MYTISNERYAEVFKELTTKIAQDNSHSTFWNHQPRYDVTSSLVTSRPTVTVVIEVRDRPNGRKWIVTVGSYPIIGRGDSPDLDIIRTWEVADQLAASIQRELDSQ